MMAQPRPEHDRRITPATERVALSRLRGTLPRPFYTEGVAARIGVPLAELSSLPPDQPGSARDRQLLFGADVTVIETRDEASFVQAAADGYCGWLDSASLTRERPAVTHRVSAAATHLYSEPSFKRPELCALPLNARLSVTAIEGGFARLATGGFVPVQAISDAPAQDPVAVAETLIFTPYLWGGNSRAGLDCSGLVQAALHACAIPCPGDADLQEAAFAPVEQILRGDLLFWPGHVAIACGDGRMIHATASTMCVIHEDIARATARIDAAGDGPLRGARRPPTGAGHGDRGTGAGEGDGPPRGRLAWP